MMVVQPCATVAVARRMPARIMLCLLWVGLGIGEAGRPGGHKQAWGDSNRLVVSESSQ